MKSIDRSTPPCGYIDPMPTMHRITDQAPSISCAVGRYTANAWVVESGSSEDVNELTMLNHGWQSSAAAMVPFAIELARNNPSLAVVIPHQPRILGPRRIADIYPYIHEVSRAEVSELRVNTALRVGEAACDKYGVRNISTIGHSAGNIDQVHMALRAETFQVDKITSCMGAGLSTSEETAGMIKRILQTNWRRMHLQAPQVMMEGFVAATAAVLPVMKQLREAGVQFAGLDAENDMLFPPSEKRAAAFPNAYGIVTEGHACHQALSHITDAPLVAEAMFKIWNKVEFATSQTGDVEEVRELVPSPRHGSYGDGVVYA